MTWRRFSWPGCVGTLLIVTSTASVWAAESDPARARRAHAAFSEGVRAYEAEDYDAALEAFRRANTIVPDERVQLPIANTLEKLDRLLEARTAYRRALAAPDLPAEQAAEARDGLARVEKALTNLTITTNATTGQVEVDGASVCEIPCDPQWLVPGAHEVTLHHAHGVERRGITSKPGSTKLHVHVTPPPVEPVHTFPGWLGWTGMGLATLGTAGAIGFGIRTESLQDRYIAELDPSVREEAVTSRTLTNASIGIAVTGAAVIVADLIWAAVDGPGDPAPPSEAALRWHF